MRAKTRICQAIYRLQMLLIAFALSFSIRLQASASPFDRSYAIVIGISDYASSAHWHHLPYARKDAEAVHRQLKSQGYEVTPLYDQAATKSNIQNAFAVVSRKLGIHDRVVVVISTHGTIDSTGPATHGYVIPYDGTNYASYLSNNE